MRTLDVGSRFSMLALRAVTMLAVMLLSVSACSDQSSAESASASRQLSEHATAEPQQVVQRIVATPDAVGARTPARSGHDGSRAVVSEARGAAAGSAQRGGDALPSRANNREPITSMHLEAELNRLEAELAN